MAILEIPTITTGEPHYQFRMQLDGSDFQFTFRFGERRACWMFDLATLEGVEILTGQMVTCARDLLRRAAMPERPLGKLWAMNVILPTSDEGGPLAMPGLYDLGPGARCRMYYTEATT